MENKEINRMKILAGLNESTIKKLDKDLSMIEIINKFDYLKKAFKYIVLNNKSNIAPYHNFNHLLTVTSYCYRNAIRENLDKKEMKNLLLAAIFHDFNHSMGKKKDDENIKVVKKEIRKFIDSEKIEDVDLNEVDKILDATQYPYVLDNKDLNLSQKIIRDSDLMQIFEYNWIHQNVFGLSSELKIDVVDFLSSQRKFLENCEFQTDFCKKIKKERWKQVMKEFDMLEKICKG